MKIPRIRRSAAGAGLAALALTLLFGVQPPSLWITTQAGYFTVPPAVGVPHGPPGLHLTEFGDIGWTWTLWETAAALLFIGLTTVRIHARAGRLSTAGRVRMLLCGWWSCVLAAAAAGVLRGAVTAWFAYAGAGGYLTYALFGALFGALWGALLGWFPGALALGLHASRRPDPTPEDEPEPDPAPDAADS